MAQGRLWQRIAVVVGVVATLILLGWAWHGHRPGDADGASASDRTARPVPVRTAVVEPRAMPVRVDVIGTVEPLATVAVKSRIDGLIVDVGFAEGNFVEAGHVLFRLDDRAARAQLAQAEANLAREQAQLADAERILARNVALAERGFAAKATLDTARAAQEALKASTAGNEAQIRNLRTLLDYTVVRAPIAGRTGEQAFKLGSNVKANDSALVTINQTRPIAVSFAVPQTELAAIRAAQAKQPLPVTVRVRGSRPVTAEGTLSFIDNAVNQATGTITLKATLANADEALWPGQFVDVSVLVATVANVAAVPKSSVLIGQNGAYVFVVRADRTVDPRPVAVERTLYDTTYISSGLAAGERVVTDNQLRLAPGSAVTIEDAPAATSARDGGA
ncbi:MAG TPA: efflux RND transporter periplasmic adaptor subunit [Rhodospirillales bacterium]|nr:efflux RND transporter periplasmic adaptor subunit [Rhodospirillales bacterium]